MFKATNCMKLEYDITAQLQTVDGCNARCYKCPASYIYHSYQLMTDFVFEKIVWGIFRLNKKTLFAMYLQNEPLLDPLLFKRIEFIKKIFGANAFFEISTNGILAPKFYKEIIEYFDVIIISIQGWNVDSFNAIHRTNISQKQFENIIYYYQEIKKRKEHVFVKQFKYKLAEGYHIQDVDKWYRMQYSRAGFLSNNRILKTKLHGCARNKHKILNFLYDGSMILCCMDYLRQTVLGNIKHQSLRDILQSNLYKTYISKVEGIIPSEQDFICKKCELAK